MRDTDPKIVQEIVDEYDQPWHRCVICKMQWKPRTPAVHHDRCAIGNLQSLVRRLTSDLDDAKRRGYTLRGVDRQIEESQLVRWRTWAGSLLGRIAKQASDAGLRYRLEERMRSDASAIERELRVRVAELEEQVADLLQRNREYYEIQREPGVTDDV